MRGPTRETARASRPGHGCAERRWRLARLAGLVVCAAIGSRVNADVVFLKNGKEIEGDVSPGSAPGRVRVTVDLGSFIEIDEADIDRIVKKRSPASEFDARFKRLEREDLDAHLALASWARERKLGAREEKVYRAILRFAPNNPVARKGLGYVVHGNRWVRSVKLRTSGLVKLDGEWMSPQERDRRILEKLRDVIDEDFRGVDSDNEYVQEYSIQKIMDLDSPWARHIIVDYLAHPKQAVRVVAVQAVARLSEAAQRALGAKGAGKSRGKRPRRRTRSDRLRFPERPPGAAAEQELEERLSRILLDRTLREENSVARKALTNAVMRICPRRYFELAVETAGASTNTLHRERAAEGAIYALKKAWVPELLDALGRTPAGLPTAGNPSVRRVLKHVFKRDFEYDVAAWKAWWREHERRFRDE